MNAAVSHTLHAHRKKNFTRCSFVRSLTELEMFRYFRDIFIHESWEERMAFIEENAGLLGRIETEPYGKKAA